jgi:hypothetical protein
VRRELGVFSAEKPTAGVGDRYTGRVIPAGTHLTGSVLIMLRCWSRRAYRRCHRCSVPQPTPAHNTLSCCIRGSLQHIASTTREIDSRGRVDVARATFYFSYPSNLSVKHPVNRMTSGLQAIEARIVDCWFPSACCAGLRWIRRALSPPSRQLWSERNRAVWPCWVVDRSHTVVFDALAPWMGAPSLLWPTTGR